MTQMSFPDAEYAGKRKQTRRERFLQEMEQVAPWKALLALIDPVYPKAGNGRRPYPMDTILRIHLLQNWFGYSDPAMEEALYEVAPLRRFAGLSLSRGSVPDETTILNFRRLLETHVLGPALLSAVNMPLTDRGLQLRQGTIVDATIIHAAPSTKNKTKSRDPDMHQTRKGNQWYFGMKAHIGVDAGYTGAEKRKGMTKRGRKWLIAAKRGSVKAMPEGELKEATQHLEYLKAAVRSKVEHPFRVIKRQFGYQKVRFKGLAKNTGQILTLFALSNLWMVRRSLLLTAGEVRP